MLHKGFDIEISNKVTSAPSGVAYIPLRPQSIEACGGLPWENQNSVGKSPTGREPYPSICWPSSLGVVISSTLGGFWLRLITQQRRSMIPGRGLKNPSYGAKTTRSTNPP